MPRPRLTDEERKQKRAEQNARYYEKHREVVLEKNRENSKVYYYKHKEVVNKRVALRNKNMRQEFKQLKAIVEEQLKKDRETSLNEESISAE